MPSKINEKYFKDISDFNINSFADHCYSNIVPAVDWNGNIHIWDIQNRKKLYEIGIPGQFGGTSFAVSNDGSFIVLGSYYAWGCAAFSIDQGRFLWHRKDLKRFYNLSISNDNKIISGGFLNKAAIQLNAKNGETKEKFRGLKEFYTSPYSAAEVRVYNDIRLVNSGNIISKFQPTSFAILDMAFSPKQFTVSESSSIVRCFSIENASEQLWSFKPNKDCHLIALGYNEKKNCFIGVEYEYDTPNNKKRKSWLDLVHFDTKGSISFRAPIGSDRRLAICGRGSRLINALGQIYDTSTADLLFEFGFPQPSKSG